MKKIFIFSGLLVLFYYSSYSQRKYLQTSSGYVSYILNLAKKKDTSNLVLMMSDKILEAKYKDNITEYKKYWAISEVFNLYYKLFIKYGDDFEKNIIVSDNVTRYSTTETVQGDYNNKLQKWDERTITKYLGYDGQIEIKDRNTNKLLIAFRATKAYGEFRINDN